MFLSKKKHKIEKLVFDYLTLACKCLECCEENYQYYYEHNRSDDDFFEHISAVHKYESLSDDKRKEIEYMMYSKSLIPESRGDVLGLLEAIDRVPNDAETLLHEIYMANIVLPQEFRDDFYELFQVNIKAASLAIDIAKSYFEFPARIIEIQKNIDALESQSDKMQTRLCRKVFTSDLGSLEKILMQDMISSIGKMSDSSEKVGDRVKLLSVKTIF